MKVSLLTGGKDCHYMIGLASGLADTSTTVDVIGSDDLRHPDLTERSSIEIYSFREPDQRASNLRKRIARVVKYYARLLAYAATTDSKIFHIQWLNSFPYFDRTVLNVYYRLLGKRLVFTAHNINAAARDGRDSLLNRLTLRFMYGCVQHIIVHTREMKEDLVRGFGVDPDKVTVTGIGLNLAVRDLGVSRESAREKLGVTDTQKVLLFFGNISQYKGLEDLILAAAELKRVSGYEDLKVIIAGRIKERRYWVEVKKLIRKHGLEDCMIERPHFIPDDEVEIYYRGADVLVLPYKAITQSGMTVLAYRFGLPVIATDVGAFREDIVEGQTGLLYAPGRPSDLASKVQLFFEGDLFRRREVTRRRIEEHAVRKYSWRSIADRTREVYRKVGGETESTKLDNVPEPVDGRAH